MSLHTHLYWNGVSQWQRRAAPYKGLNEVGVQVKCYSLSFPGIAHLPVHGNKYDLNWQEIEKLKREGKKKDEEVKNLKKKLNEIQWHQQHFRTGSGEGVSSFFKVSHHLLILSVANWNNENICQTVG